VAAVQPGSTFHLAVKLTMQPGWHVYWINPGDSGLPTEVKFNAPGGYKVEFMGHPTPIEFDQPGNVVGYGYKESVMLVALVTVPADAKPGAMLEFSASAKWLVCKDVCLPGKATVSLQLPVSETPAAANLSAFSDALNELPTDASTHGTAARKVDGEVHVLSLKWQEPVSNVQVFTAPGDAWTLGNLKAETKDGVTEIRFSPKKLFKSAKSVEMTVVIAYDDAKGRRRSVKMTDRLGAE